MQKYGVPYFVLSKKCRGSFSAQNSKPNLYFKSLLEKANIPFDREYVINEKAYDFKVNDILIEINPTATHNSHKGIFGNKPIDSNYHSNESDLAEKNNFRCIHVWDWDDLDKIVDLLKDRPSIGAIKCECREIEENTASSFLDKYHIQGSIKAKRFFGIYNKDNLIGVMTFDTSRYNKRYQWELIRYATSCNIQGGAEKLFKFCIEKLNASSIISYCDRSKFSGNVYEKLGFKKIRTSIGKHWYNSRIQKHITDNLLRQHGFDRLLGKDFGVFGKEFSNEDLMHEFKFFEVYDVGQITYIWQA